MRFTTLGVALAAAWFGSVVGAQDTGSTTASGTTDPPPTVDTSAKVEIDALAVVKVRSAAVRSLPSKDIAVSRRLDKGATVHLVAKLGAWRQFHRHGKNGSVKGWIEADDLQGPSKENFLGTVKHRRTRVRVEPNRYTRTVKRLKKGNTVHVVAKLGDWRRISGKKGGWIRRSDVKYGVRRYVKVGFDSKLSVHTRPSLGSHVRKTLKRGTAVRVFQKKGNWRRIDKPTKGWVHKTYVSAKKPSMTRPIGPTFWGTAYKYGRAYRIQLVRIDGKAVALKSAGPFLKMRAAAARSGVRIYVVSGFRTMSEQIALWNRYGSPRAARPGYSNHQSGTAFDLNTAGFYGSVYNWLTAHAWSYGFKRTVSFEPWHWEYMR